MEKVNFGSLIQRYKDMGLNEPSVKLEVLEPLSDWTVFYTTRKTDDGKTTIYIIMEPPEE